MMEVYNNEIIEIDVKESFFILLHKLWLIVIIGILFAICTGLVNIYLLTPVYRSTSRIHTIRQQENDKLSFEDTGTSSELLRNDIDFIKSKAVMEQIIQQLQLDLSPAELTKRITVNNVQDTWILEINVVYDNPITAKRITDALTNKLFSEKLVSGMKPERIVRIEEGDLPTIPFNPNLSKNILLGAICGILFSIAFLALGHLPNGSNKNVEYMEQCPGTARSVVDFLRIKLTGRKERRARLGERL